MKSMAKANHLLYNEFKDEIPSRKVKNQTTCSEEDRENPGATAVKHTCVYLL
jgi:hypothetical protein